VGWRTRAQRAPPAGSSAAIGTPSAPKPSTCATNDEATRPRASVRSVPPSHGPSAASSCNTPPLPAQPAPYDATDAGQPDTKYTRFELTMPGPVNKPPTASSPVGSQASEPNPCPGLNQKAGPIALHALPSH